MIMTRLYKLRWLLFLVAVSCLGACNKWLELKPADGIVGDSYWKTKEQLSAGVMGIYASLIGNPPGVSDKLLAEYLFMWGELRADMVVPSAGASGDDIDIYNTNLLSSNTNINWRAAYRTINYCNTVIAFGPSVMEKDNTLTETQLNNYLAEAYGIRGLLYFYLARSFGDVPLKLTATTSDEQLEQLAKSKQADVLTQIVADLTKAELLAVTTYGNKANDKGRVTKYTANSILADVYLWMEKYDESIAACNKIINAGQFGLIAGNSSWFSTLYYSGNSNEAIFEFQFDNQALNPFYGLFMTSRRRYEASGLVMEEMYTIDYEHEDSVDLRGTGAAVRVSDNTIWKSVGVDYNTAVTQDASYNHWIVYRYADILLMKAEALNQKGQGQDALDIVYRIRERGHALSATDTKPGADDKDAVADFILAERAREFAFEGKRWYDILRNAKRSNYERINVLLDMIAKTVPVDRQQSALAKYKDHNSHYSPIYLYELQTDKNLVQNPFYQ
jgi:tetratricopeptide (TPR) repeat protein